MWIRQYRAFKVINHRHGIAVRLKCVVFKPEDDPKLDAFERCLKHYVRLTP